jgi:hypothetical protein
MLLNDQLLVGGHYVISMLFNFQLSNTCHECSKQTSNFIYQMQLNKKILSGANFKQALKSKKKKKTYHC